MCLSVIFGQAHFAAQKLFERISENLRRFFKSQYYQAKKGKHHQLSNEEVRMWNPIAESL